MSKHILFEFIARCNLNVWFCAGVFLRIAQFEWAVVVAIGLSHATTAGGGKGKHNTLCNKKRASKHCHRQKKWKEFEEIAAQRLTGLMAFLNTHQIAGVNEKEMPTKNYTAKSLLLQFNTQISNLSWMANLRAKMFWFCLKKRLTKKRFQQNQYKGRYDAVFLWIKMCLDNI